MKLLWIGFKPSRELSKILRANHFIVETLTHWGPVEADWTIARIKTEKDLEQARRYVDFHPRAVLSFVVEGSSLDDVGFHSQLLAFETKFSVLTKNEFESFFWFHLQSFIDRRKLLSNRNELQKENVILTQESEELFEHSHQMVSRLEKDVGLAESIQRSLLPRITPQFPGVSLSAKYLPAAGLGGDYYDVFEFGDRKRLGIILSDSKTHGMAAALLSVLLKLRLEEMKDRFPDSKSFVQHLNEEIHHYHARDLSSLSLLYGIFDRASLSFQFTTAGSIRPVLWRQGTILTIAPNLNPPLGEMTTYSFQEERLQLKPGDLLLLHTDGLEAPLGAKSGQIRGPLEKLLQSSADSLNVQNNILALIDRYTEKKPLPDDLTLLQLVINEKVFYVASNESQG